MSKNRTTLNDLHAVAHEVTDLLRRLGILEKEDSLQVEKFPHLPYRLAQGGDFREDVYEEISALFPPAGERGRWHLGKTIREALLVLEATQRVLHHWVYSV